MTDGSGIRSTSDYILSMRSGTGSVWFTDANSASLSGSISPAVKADIVDEADSFLAHHFDLLGSGSQYLGIQLPWHRDFKSGHEWNRWTFYSQVRPAAYPGGYDIKVPWELSRAQHLVRLGQAYLLTGNDAYALETRDVVNDWIAANPHPFGVNWACTMDVAIRAVNWLWAFRLTRRSSAWRDSDVLRLGKSLWQHGHHIAKNLENRSTVPNNHYLANLAGLVYLGVLCPEFREAKSWRGSGHQGLCEETLRQVLEDGANAEASVCYHRLALELLLSPLLLSEINGAPMPTNVRETLARMLEYTLAYTFPDGSVPILGDADNGRLHRLAVYRPPSREWSDHRYLLAIGACLLSRSDFAACAADEWQDALWYFGGNEVTRARASAGPPALRLSKGFPTAGTYVLRDDDASLVVTTGGTPRQLARAHGHNDLLSFEFFCSGTRWIVDPGTCCYTDDYYLRHRMRSTQSHSTLSIDGQEQNHIDPQRPFEVSKRSHAEVEEWIHTDSVTSLRGVFTWQGNLRHVRHFSHVRGQKEWSVDDVVHGLGVHEVTVRLCVAPDATLTQIPTRSGWEGLLTKGRHPPLTVRLTWSPNLDAGVRVLPAHVSPSYGDLTPTYRIEASFRGPLPIHIHTLLTE